MGKRFAVSGFGTDWPGRSDTAAKNGSAAIPIREPILMIVIKSCKESPHMTPSVLTALPKAKYDGDGEPTAAPKGQWFDAQV